jgi:ABC-type uncharacterized transport system involved in gliding motility auxiliary subunit
MTAWKSIALAGLLLSVPPAWAQTSGGAAPGTAAPGQGVASVPDATVQKVGAALHDVAQIQQSYAQRMQSVQGTNQRQSMVQQARADAVKAVNARGLSVDQYNQVIRLAQADPTLKQRLVSIAEATK